MNDNSQLEVSDNELGLVNSIAIDPDAPEDIKLALSQGAEREVERLKAFDELRVSQLAESAGSTPIATPTPSQSFTKRESPVVVATPSEVVVSPLSVRPTPNSASTTEPTS